jgi:hypothetical protein
VKFPVILSRREKNKENTYGEYLRFRWMGWGHESCVVQRPSPAGAGPHGCVWLAQRAFRSRVLFTTSAGKGDACSSAGAFIASAGASSRGVPAGGRPTASESHLSLGATMHASTPRTVRLADPRHAPTRRWRPRRGESTGGRRRDAVATGCQCRLEIGVASPLFPWPQATAPLPTLITTTHARRPPSSLFYFTKRSHAHARRGKGGRFGAENPVAGDRTAVVRHGKL